MSENKVDDVLIPEEVEIEIGDKKVVITELPRKKYKKLFSVLSGVIEDIDAFEIEDTEDEIMSLFSYLADDVLLEIYSIATGLNTEFLEDNLTLSTEIELFVAICEVNRIGQIVKNLKKLKRPLAPLMETLKSLR